MMRYVIPEVDAPYHQILTVVLFIGAFILVRKVSFRQVKKSSAYEIRKAGDLDVSAILSINNSYFNEAHSSFLKNIRSKRSFN